MRATCKSILASAVTMALIATLTPVASANDYGPIAVIDVAKIFKESPAIKEQVKNVEAQLDAIKKQVESSQKQLKIEAEKLKTFEAGTPNYTAQESKVAEMESKLRLEMVRKRKELQDAEAKIYYENYQKITEICRLFAEGNGFKVVLRYNSEDMDLKQGATVVRGVMKNVVYHDPNIDLTVPVMNRLGTARVANRP